MKHRVTEIPDEINQIIENVDMRHDSKIEGERLARTLEESRDLNRNLESCISEAKVVCAELKGATEAAKELKITLKLTPERQAVLDRSQDRILDKEKQMLSAHEKRNRDLIDSMQDDMVNRIRNSGGVWMSKRVFWWLFLINLIAWGFTLGFWLLKV